MLALSCTVPRIQTGRRTVSAKVAAAGHGCTPSAGLDSGVDRPCGQIGGPAVDDEELKVRVGARHLLAEYQYLADRGDTQKLSELFLPDAVFKNNTEELTGRPAILDFFRRTADAFVSAELIPARHHLSSVYIEPRDQRQAGTYACFGFVGQYGLDHWGVYRDNLAYTEDGWRFASRKAIVEG